VRVFYTSPWVPVEWIAAHGMEPRGVWMDIDLKIPHGPSSAGVCAFANSIIEFSRANPADAVIFTTHCDQLRRGFDLAVESQPNLQNLFLFNLPATIGTEASRKVLRNEIQRLGQFLLRLGGHAPRDLETIVPRYNAARQFLLKWISSASSKAGAEAITRFLDNASVPTKQPSMASPPGAIPVALVGGPVPQSEWDIFDTIENAGGWVALNGTENGERALEPVGEFHDIGIDWMIDSYATRCVDIFQRPNRRFYEWLKKESTVRRIKAILLWSHVNCDLWRAEVQSLKEAFHLPVLSVETNETRADAARARTRIEAFMESLQ